MCGAGLREKVAPSGQRRCWGGRQSTPRGPSDRAERKQGLKKGRRRTAKRKRSGAGNSAGEATKKGGLKFACDWADMCSVVRACVNDLLLLMRIGVSTVWPLEEKQ